MLQKSLKFKERFDELTELIVKPEIIADNKEWKKLVKERSGLEELVETRNNLEKVINELALNEQSIQTETDHEMLALYKEENHELKKQKEELENALQILLLPKDEDDDKDCIIEIRGAAGGEESALFAGVLMNMYIRYAERQHWKYEVNDVSETELGGVKECSLTIRGKDVFSKMKYESGVHRVQRVPETESQGRVHTSTSTVAVLPEVEDVDVEILDKDIKVDTYRSSGAGGQHVNKTESAIRITHFPTGIVVTCQDERSQIKNRERAMSILKSKLYSFYKEQADSKYAANRKSQVGTGDRSERIRTYNYPQGRITDHRINYSIFNIEPFLDGDMDELVKALQTADQQARLDELNNSEN
ncbi:MAG: peptide chain release factor 1 [Clostridiales bacterium]|nr:peptide chain release factor 1 [Clostridiales bacterium]